MKDGLFSDGMLQKIQKIRKVFLRVGVWILIAELVAGVVLIMSESWNDVVGKIQGTFLAIALVLLISVNNFARIEKGSKAVQAFALMGFVGNLIWGVLAVLLIWEIMPSYTVEQVQIEGLPGRYYNTTQQVATYYARFMLAAICMAGAGFWISNIMSIKETVKPVKPLKITAIICVMYLWIFETIVFLFKLENTDGGIMVKLYQLVGLAGLAFIITALAARIVSRANEEKVVEVTQVASMNNGESAQQVAPKTDDELRAEIEEKVRREMIEKEVRAKLEAERLSNMNDEGGIDNSEEGNSSETE